MTPRSLLVVGAVALISGCAPTVSPAVSGAPRQTGPAPSIAEPLATEARILSLLPLGARVVLVSDGTGIPDDRGTFDLGRLGDAGIMAVAMACDGEGPLLLDVVRDQFPVQTVELGLAMTECMPGGELDLSRLAVDSPDDRIVVSAPPATRWRVAIART